MLGDTVLGKISLPGESDEFSFSGSAGQRIYIDALQYSGAAGNWKFDIISPSGQNISTGDLNSNRIFDLKETGNYRIVTSALGDTTGSYGFSVGSTSTATPTLNINGLNVRNTDTNGMHEGLRQTIDWYKANEEWWQAEKAKVEAAYAKQGQ